MKSDRELMRDRYPDQFDEDHPTVPCPACGGSGIAVEGWDCEECDGMGYFEM